MALLRSSFRARLIAGAVIWITAGLAVSGFVLSELFRAHVTEQFDDELHGHAAELANLASVDAQGRPYLHHRLSDPRFLSPDSGFYWRLQAPDGAGVSSESLGARVLHLPGATPAPGVERHDFIDGPTGPLRLVERSVTPKGASAPFRIAMAVEQRRLDEVLAHFNWTLVWSLGFIALGLIGAAGLQVWFGLSPLYRVREALLAVRKGRLARLPEDLPSEVRPLVMDLNGLLEANLEMLQRARVQAGNLAHALKTPLAILADEAERLRSQGQDEAAQAIAMQIERMRRQIDFQIARSRAAALRSAPGLAASINSVIEPILSAMRRLHGQKPVAFDIVCPPQLVVALEAQDLGEILGNLLDNAGKWAASRVEIKVVATAGGRVLVTIDDDGPGLPPEAFELVFGIGQRLDEQVPGHGLGLAIVRDLVTLYGGRIWLEAAPIGGLRASLDLPTTVAV